ncbi:dehydrogenase [Marmoricola endophyticus]|uniref:Dehydrogenase n=1 Tax=Marmoricola endophyticus TaxID=2040280 RepID=A0A917BR51_9ACTN|nr:SDR family oxidoreductase [Marmoricola endophyticus]GGF52949.1 dehydrogenase [Marmoricola endophyticus]
MQWQGARVVVTGAGRGIGRALAERAAAEGAQVLVNDLDPQTAADAAAAVGGTSYAGDVSTTQGAAGLVDAAFEHLGGIDVFFANAGVDLGGGLDASDEDWARSLDVNVMAHVRTARALVPRWLETGAPGRFVVTASAAGLLTMIGAAPYSVTKHAAVAFAEWLSITYADQGVTVHAICPQGVNTAMLQGSGPVQGLLSHDAAIEPADVADAAWAAIEEGSFLILPHPEVAGYYAARAADTDRWLGGMRKLQRKVFGA